jgi:sulfate transport system ATP-binding protein
VNIFRGRVEGGKALLGPIALDYPEHSAATPQPAAGYARPHELALGRHDDGGGLWATLVELNATGPIVKVELTDDSGMLIQVQLSRESYEALRPTAGERLYVKPRRVRVFLSA